MLDFLNFLNNVIGYGNKFVDVFLMLQVMYYCFPPKASVENKIRPILVAWGIVAAVANIVADLMISMPFYIFLLVYFLIGFCFAILFLQGKIYAKMFMGVAYTACSIICRFLIYGIGSSVVANIENQKLLVLAYILQNLTIQVLLILLVIFLIRNAIKVNLNLPVYYWLAMLAIILVDFMIVVPLRSTASETTLSKTLVILLICNSLIVIIMLYYLFSKLTKEYEEKSDYMLVKQQLNMQKSHMKESAEMYQNLRRIRHELKNHIFCMKLMLEEKKYEELQEYFMDLYCNEYTVNDMVDTGNTLVNSVLNQKMSYAKSKGIEAQAQTFIPEQLNVKDSELCAILANLLDNAIEACSSLSDPQIEIELKVVKNYLAIVIKNTVPKSVLKENPELHTTKQDRENHGFGLKVIRNVAQKYDGLTSFSEEDGYFVASVMLKLSPCDKMNQSTSVS